MVGVDVPLMHRSAGLWTQLHLGEIIFQLKRSFDLVRRVGVKDLESIRQEMLTRVFVCVCLCVSVCGTVEVLTRSNLGPKPPELVSPSPVCVCYCAVAWRPLLVLASGPECVLHSGSGLRTGLFSTTYVGSVFFFQPNRWSGSQARRRQKECVWPRSKLVR